MFARRGADLKAAHEKLDHREKLIRDREAAHADAAAKLAVASAVVDDRHEHATKLMADAEELMARANAKFASLRGILGDVPAAPAGQHYNLKAETGYIRTEMK